MKRHLIASIFFTLLTVITTFVIIPLFKINIWIGCYCCIVDIFIATVTVAFWRIYTTEKLFKDTPDKEKED